MAKTYEEFIREAKARIREIGPREARARYEADDGCLFLDVREPNEVADGTIPGALALPRGMLEGHALDTIPDLDWEIVVVCEKGNRSALAADTLAIIGFTRVTSLAGGILRWTAEGHPLGAPRVL